MLRLSSTGAAIGTAAELPGATGRWPDLAYAPSLGEYLVVWEQPNVFLVPGAVRAQRLDTAGLPVGAGFDVSARDIMGDDSFGPAVVASDAGWLTARRETA